MQTAEHDAHADADDAQCGEEDEHPAELGGHREAARAAPARVAAALIAAVQLRHAGRRRRRTTLPPCAPLTTSILSPSVLA